MKRFRAGQILEWVYRHGEVEPEAMSNLSKSDRATLAAEMTFLSGQTVSEQAATDGTRKLLVEWDESPPGETQVPPALRVLGDASRQTECVMIPALHDRADGGPAWRTACISSQVGCPVGCRFCASGLGGLDGNLSAGRIVEQVWRLDRLVKERDGLRVETDLPRSSARKADPPRSSARRADLPRISNVVFMGMGEPLANFRAVTDAIRTIASDWAMGISARRITVSTVGLHRAIERLADELDLPVTLALSLHAPNDVLRRELIPWAEFTSIDELFAACRRWFEKTGREITLEYTLLGGVNDQPEHAAELAGVAKKLRANVNLIRFNEVEGVPYARPLAGDVRRFREILDARGVNVHIRASRGRDIAAACGQLRHEHAEAS